MAYRSLVTNDKGEFVQMKLRHTEAVVECPIRKILLSEKLTFVHWYSHLTSLDFGRQG